MIRNRQAVLVAALAAAAASGNAHAFRVDYTLDTGIEYNDNILVTDGDEISQTIFRAGAGFLLNHESSTWQLDLEGRSEYRKYQDNAYSDNVETELSGRFNWTIIPERLGFTVEDDFDVDAINVFAPDAPDNRQQVNVFSAGPNLYFGLGGTFHGQFELRYIDSRAEVTDEFDSQRVALAFRALKELDETSTVSVNWQSQDVDFQHPDLARNHRRHDLFARYERHLNRFDLGFDAGYTRISYADGASNSSPLLRADFGWRPTERSRYFAQALNQYSDTTLSALQGIELEGAVPGSVFSENSVVNGSVYKHRELRFGYEFTGTRSTLSVEPFVRRLDYVDDAINDERGRGIGFEYNYRLQPSLNFRSYLNYERTQYQGIGRVDNTYRVGAALIKHWSRHWSSMLDVSRYQRDIDVLGLSLDQNVVYLSIAYHNRPSL